MKNIFAAAIVIVQIIFFIFLFLIPQIGNQTADNYTMIFVYIMLILTVGLIIILMIERKKEKKEEEKNDTSNY